MEAVLISGSASHALDYDDCSAAIGGHITVPIAAALLPLAGLLRSDGTAVIEAFVRAYEFAARCGVLIAPDHYARGFHPTATVGTISAAVACANLMELDARAIEQAVGIAATQAAGLIASFGTMCKPLHVGRAAANGLLAARLAARGFTGRDGMLEIPYGFTLAHGAGINIEKALAPAENGFYLRSNFFKFHAACGGTHPFVEAALLLKQVHGVDEEQIRRIILRVNPTLQKVCDIPRPETGLEIKFSMRTMTALGLLGRDTASPSLYTDATACDPEVAALLRLIEVEYTPERPSMAPEVIVELEDGRRISQIFQGGQPEPDLELLQDRLSRKFISLTEPILTRARAEQLLASVLDLEHVDDISTLLTLSRAV
jgi:2-methylcitrate dehydratase PrpD